MTTLLQRFILANCTPGEKELEQILSLFRPEKIKRNTLLLCSGETCNDLYFVSKGCLRTYYINEGGKERSRYLALEGMICTALASFISRQPSFELLDTLEDTEVLSIRYADFHELTRTVPAWNTFYKTLLEQAYLHNTHRIGTLVTLPAKQRYELLLQQQPQLIKRLPNKIIASYLDISQETLSRLKSG